MSNKVLENMTDFEINRLFLICLRNHRGFHNNDSVLNYPHASDKRSAGVVQDGNYFWYDFCNQAKDSYLYLVANGITQIKLEDGRWMAITEYKGKDVTRYSAIDISPLRAGIMAILKQSHAANEQA